MTAKLTRDDGYLDKFQKLIPAEITGAYIAVNSLIPEIASVIWLYAVAAILTIACFFYGKIFREITNSRHLFFLTFIAFPIWAINIIEYRIEWLADPTVNFIPGVLVILISIFAPFFVEAESDA